jgi:hypothetical protein
MDASGFPVDRSAFDCGAVGSAFGNSVGACCGLAGSTGPCISPEPAGAWAGDVSPDDAGTATAPDLSAAAGMIGAVSEVASPATTVGCKDLLLEVRSVALAGSSSDGLPVATATDVVHDDCVS